MKCRSGKTGVINEMRETDFPSNPHSFPISSKLLSSHKRRVNINNTLQASLQCSNSGVTFKSQVTEQKQTGFLAKEGRGRVKALTSCVAGVEQAR